MHFVFGKNQTKKKHTLHIRDVSTEQRGSASQTVCQMNYLCASCQ